MDALYGLDLTSTVCNIDGQKDSVAPRIYSELAQELDHFMRWLDNEVRNHVNILNLNILIPYSVSA
jgi:hypothetical protein